MNTWNNLAGQSKPRFSMVRGGRAHISFAWHENSHLLACGGDKGHVEVWDLRNARLGALANAAPVEAQHVAWAPRTHWLAYGGSDGRVFFRRGPDGKGVYESEVGVGHVHGITAATWSNDGEVLATGTDGGTIGLWPASLVDNQLRNALLTPGSTSAHEDAIHSLAWSPGGDVLASASPDGHLHLWSVGEGRLLDTFSENGTAVLWVTFAMGGELLVAQTLHQIHILRLRSLEEIARYTWPSVLSPFPTPMAFHAATGHLATVDARTHTIDVWALDLAGLLDASAITQRCYSTAGVAIFGDRGSGRTTLAKALALEPLDQPVTPDVHTVHLLTLEHAHLGPGAIEKREVAFWDLPSGSDGDQGHHALIQRMHAGDEMVRIIVLLPEAEREPEYCLARWQHTIRRYRPDGAADEMSSIVVIGHSDEMPRRLAAQEVASLCTQLGVDRLFCVSVVGEDGEEDVDELRAAILDAIDWGRAKSFGSAEVFAYLRKFVASQRQLGRNLMTIQELHHTFSLTHSSLGVHVPSEEDCRTAVHMLEVLGEVEFFIKRDEVLLNPRYFHVYALEMIAAAGRDEKKMGRLPLEDTIAGRHLAISDSLRLRSKLDKRRLDERRLIEGTIDELERTGVAQRRSTDDGNFLVLPTSITKIPENLPPLEQRAESCTLPCASERLYETLVVRFLASAHYSEPELWKNAAIFPSTSGGNCGLIFDPPTAELSTFFTAETSPATQAAFRAVVHKHVRERHPNTEWRSLAPPTTAATSAKRATSVEVFLCHHTQDKSLRSVISIAKQLQARGIRAWLEELETQPGDTGKARMAQLNQSRVAAMFFDGPPTEALRGDWEVLLRRQCGIIPVILPTTPKEFQIPKALGRSEVDFRDVDERTIDRLVDGINERWRESLQPRASESVDGAPPVLAHHEKRPLRSSIFVSYSHRDIDHLARLKVHLEPLVRHEKITYWDDTKLKAGDVWRSEIRTAVEEAGAAVLLISADFLASKFIVENELPPLLQAAKERGSLVVPVILGPCGYEREPGLRDFQAVNPLDRPVRGMKWNRREQLWQQVAERIRTALA